MIITAAIEAIETGAVEYTDVECQDYVAGYAQLKRTIPEGTRLLSVRVDRA